MTNQLKLDRINQQLGRIDNLNHCVSVTAGILERHETDCAIPQQDKTIVLNAVERGGLTLAIIEMTKAITELVEMTKDDLGIN